MDTQVLRVTEWREQKRKAGYQPLTVWLKADVKHLIEDLASQRRQDLAEVVSEAIRTYAGQQRTPVPVEYVDAASVRRLVAEYMQDLGREVSPVPAPDVPRSAPHLPEEPSSVLVRGEYGWIVQAVRTEARGMGRFTCQTMAKRLGTPSKNVLKTLYAMAKRGELIKKGTVYLWVEPTTPGG
jgi:hypothetical protein